MNSVERLLAFIGEQVKGLTESVQKGRQDRGSGMAANPFDPNSPLRRTPQGDDPVRNLSRNFSLATPRALKKGEDPANEVHDVFGATQGLLSAGANFLPQLGPIVAFMGKVRQAANAWRHFQEVLGKATANKGPEKLPLSEVIEPKSFEPKTKAVPFKEDWSQLKKMTPTVPLEGAPTKPKAAPKPDVFEIAKPDKVFAEPKAAGPARKTTSEVFALAEPGIAKTEVVPSPKPAELPARVFTQEESRQQARAADAARTAAAHAGPRERESPFRTGNVEPRFDFAEPTVKPTPSLASQREKQPPQEELFPTLARPARFDPQRRTPYARGSEEVPSGPAPSMLENRGQLPLSIGAPSSLPSGQPAGGAGEDTFAKMFGKAIDDMMGKLTKVLGGIGGAGSPNTAVPHGGEHPLMKLMSNPPAAPGGGGQGGGGVDGTIEYSRQLGTQFLSMALKTALVAGAAGS